MMRITAGAPGLLLAAIVWLILSITSMAGDAPAIAESRGVILPAPSQWGMPYTLSCILNLAATALCASGLWIINKAFNILPGLLFSTLFLCLCGTFPQLNAGLSPSLLTALIVLLCTYMLFKLYGRRNATTACLSLFSILSWGSMMQSACLLLMPIFLLGTVFLQVCRPREFIASLLGIITPYWIVLGFGIVSPEQLHFELPLNITHIAGDPQMLIGLLVTAGVAALALIMLMLYNALHMLSAGVKMRAYHSFVNLLGFACIWFMLFDTANFLTYLATMLLSLSFVATRTFTISRSPRAWVLPASLCAIFIILYFLF